MASKPRFYWDTSCFICLLNSAEQARREICEDVLNHAMDGELEIITSCFTIAEVIKPKGAPIPLSEEKAEKIRRMFRWPWIVVIEVDPTVGHYAADLSRQYGLKPADAVHAASAILNRASALYAWDRDFTAVAKHISALEPTYLTQQMSLPVPETAEDSPTTEPVAEKNPETDKKTQVEINEDTPPAKTEATSGDQPVSGLRQSISVNDVGAESGDRQSGSEVEGGAGKEEGREEIGLGGDPMSSKCDELRDEMRQLEAELQQIERKKTELEGTKIPTEGTDAERYLAARITEDQLADTKKLLAEKRAQYEQIAAEHLKCIEGEQVKGH